ncbi:MAG: Uma2 family endonuclease [Bryobacteraceae bacterium]
MIESGTLDEDSGVELLEGWLVPTVPKNPAHTFVLWAVQGRFSELLRNGYYIRAQEPITLADSEPEPDLVVARGTGPDYETRHPGPADVGVVVEVSGATLDRDRGIKKRIYARAGIAQYWLFDLSNRKLLVWTRPLPDAPQPDYGTVEAYSDQQSVPVNIEGLASAEIPVANLLPRVR